MKVLVFVVLAILGVSLVQATRDLKPVHVNPNLVANFRKFKPRITGGEEVEPHSLPYQVGLFINTPDGTNFCGGSLISPTTVITAAHCAEISQDIDVVLGAHKIREQEDTQVIVKASEIIVHKDWNSLLLINDIAILRLADPVTLNDNIGLIDLPTRSDVNDSFENDLATASGWGKDSDASTSISPVLRSIEVPVTSNGICNIYYLGAISETNICVGTDGGKSTCNGDSGGPLRSSDGKLIGLTSFGIVLGCEVGWPAVFTRVTSYLDWIEANSDVTIKN